MNPIKPLCGYSPVILKWVRILLGLMVRLAGLASIAVVIAPFSVYAAEEAPTEYMKASAELRETVGGSVIAILAPSTPVIVRAKEGTHLKIEVRGWSPMGGSRYMFKGVGERINRAVLTEAGVAKRVVVDKKDDSWDSTWESATVTGWIEQGDVALDIDAVWKEASTLYFSRCSRCHSLRRPEEFTANQWPSILKVMGVRAGLSAEQTGLVASLLQSHAKDQKGDDFFTRNVPPPTPAAPRLIAKIVGTPQLAIEGGALFQSANCFACHGADAKTPILPEYPKLAGQNAEYLFSQILDFKDGSRGNGAAAAMKATVAPLTENQAKAIAYWLSIRQ